MAQEEAIRRHARAIPAMPQVGARDGEPATAAEVSSLDLAESVLRSCQQGYDIRARDTKPWNNNTRLVRDANAEHHEPLKDEGADRILHADRLRNSRRDLRLRRPNSRRDVSQSVAQEKVRTSAIRQIPCQRPLTMAGRVE